MKKVAVLGAGLVGKEVAKDLSRDFHVTAFDVNQTALDSAFAGFPVEAKQADLSNPASIRQVVKPFDIIVGALPGHMGKMSVQAVIEAGKPMVDIAFFPEDPFDLDDLAKKNNVTAIVDMGVAPGMSNFFMGYHQKRMKEVDTFECMVGGLPVEREWPFEYKAVFSPIDVIEEYTRPARYIENGCEVIRPALSDAEFVNFPGVGTLEAFNTDGLRSLAKTCKARNMKEKTLRYPGHIRLMQAMRDAGFFSKEPVEVKGQKVVPLDLTARVMFPKWKLEPGQREFTVMRVVIEGMNAFGRRERVSYDLLDYFDDKNKVTSMARTTGYTCSAGVHLLARGMFDRKGICPPEYVGESEEVYQFVVEYLKERNIIYTKTVTPL